jgi:hypothetical protein
MYLFGRYMVGVSRVLIKIINNICSVLSRFSFAIDSEEVIA